MPPQPKRKLSYGRQHRRRSHLALTPTKLVPCPQCHALRLPHHVCPECGNYRGTEVIAQEKE